MWVFGAAAIRSWTQSNYFILILRKDIPSCRRISKKMLPASTNIPYRKFPVWFDRNPINHVITVAPSVPDKKSGVARRIAAGPKVLEKRETLVGTMDDVPMPQSEAPRPS